MSIHARAARRAAGQHPATNPAAARHCQCPSLVSLGRRQHDVDDGTTGQAPRRLPCKMSTEYHDRWIDFTDSEVVIRGYYFPWGTKRIPYDAIRQVQRVSLGALRGRGRIWGTANPGVWASFDPRRPAKRTGFLIDNGRSVRPLITPDDPEAADACFRNHLADGVVAPSSRRGPIV
jgi:hypothetical protein